MYILDTKTTYTKHKATCWCTNNCRKKTNLNKNLTRVTHLLHGDMIFIYFATADKLKFTELSKVN